MNASRILVPVDFSECSRQAEAYACELAKKLKARVYILHAVEPVYFAGESFGPEATQPKLTAEQKRRAREAMAQLQKEQELRNAPIAERLIVSGAPPEVIVGQVAKSDIDLIVMGTHGRTGVTRVLLGSVAERVLRTSPCPVLTVREVQATKK